MAKKSRKQFIVFLIIVLVCSIGFNIKSYKKNIQLSKRYDVLINVTNELHEATLISFVTSINKAYSEQNNIEIFNISKGEVIKSIETNSIIKKEVESYIDEITGLYIRIRAFPEEGYIIRAPLDSEKEIKNYLLNNFGINSLNEIYILFPKNEDPYLLVLDKKYRPIFFNFNKDTEKLLEHLEFKIK